MNRTEDLMGLIRFHRYRYYVLNSPVITDSEYDALEKELAQLDPDNYLLQEVGANSFTKGFKTYDYVKAGAAKMLSLGKVYSATEIESFLKGREYVILLKVDGLACRAVYESGRLVQAHTRGNGETGEMVTENFAAVRGTLPKKVLEFPGRFEIRGEVYMDHETFERVRTENPKENYANPRNTASGSLKQDNPMVTASRGLRFLAYDLKIDGREFATETEMLETIRELGFGIPRVSIPDSITSIEGIIQHITKMRPNLPLDIDGIVFVLDDRSIWTKLGFTSHHPKYKMAFKFESESGSTVLLRKEWEVSRNRRIKPVGIIEPIELAGAICNRVTLHNAKFVVDNRIVDGEEIVIERSGDVIPHWLSMVSDLSTMARSQVSLPSHCPSCSTTLVFNPEQNVDLMCPNVHCPGAAKRYLEYYISKPVTNMKNFGVETVGALFDKGFIRTPADLFSLTSETLQRLDGVKERKAQKILDAIASARVQTPERFLVSLGIDGLGHEVARLIVDEIDWKTVTLKPTANLESIQGIGNVLSVQVSKGLIMARSLIESLLQFVTIDLPEEVEVNDVLNGKTFCLTGKVVINNKGQELSSRSAIEEVIRSLGGKPVGSVSSKLDFLVQGEGGGSKAAKAASLGITTLTAADLEDMLQD